MLHIFFKSVVESVISSAIISWGSSIRARDLKKLGKLIKKGGSVLGTLWNLWRSLCNEGCFIKQGTLWRTLGFLFMRPLYNNRVSSIKGFFRSALRQTLQEILSAQSHEILQRLFDETFII
ncbi:hypothetical protein CHARACLAT_030180 [Characodon lateralis]|uniref:Uncharacterized protein n=1 Tax=Characodon lateralis TaxID=208331 RepID=A0ABU7DD47_9TELE|nr:hypothetical protein [Characodon lateralis]